MLGEFSVYVGNLDPETAVADMEELLYELFLQVRISQSRSQTTLRVSRTQNPAPSPHTSLLPQNISRVT